MRRKINKHNPQKKRFLSDRSLFGVQNNTKELARAMTRTKHEKSQNYALNNTMKSPQQRPQTTHCLGRKGQKPRCNRLAPHRPSTQSNQTSTIPNLRAVSIFDNPRAQNLTTHNSPFPVKSRAKTSHVGHRNTKLRRSVPTGEKSYQDLKSKLLQKMKEEKGMTQLLNENCKTFYWSPDLSFCAFATEQQIRKTAQLWRKNKRIDSGQRMDYVLHGSKGHKKMMKNIALIPQIMEEIGK